jgi:hypothetical protein
MIRCYSSHCPRSSVSRVTSRPVSLAAPVLSQNSIASLGSDRNRVYYFSEFVGISGRQLTHLWQYQGEVMAEVSIAIAGPRWRAYSSKSLDASQLGEWTVSVIDESGGVLRKDSFVYEAPAPAPEVAAPAAPSAGEAPDEAPTQP